MPTGEQAKDAIKNLTHEVRNYVADHVRQGLMVGLPPAAFIEALVEAEQVVRTGFDGTAAPEPTFPLPAIP